MLYLTCTMISSVDLAHYGVSRVKDLVSVDCGTICFTQTWLQFGSSFAEWEWNCAFIRRESVLSSVWGTSMY